MFWNRKSLREPTPQRQKPRRVRPQLEALEDRSVPATLVGLTSTDKLFLFDSAAPTIIQRKVTITGLGAGEDMLSIDARPASGVVYGLTNQNKLYSINAYTGVATLLTAGAPAFNLQGNKVGIDFNPSVDRVRVVTNNAQNFRINPNDGALVDGDPGTGGIQPDTTLAYVDGNAGTDPKISAVAYDRNFQGATQTTLFAIDFGLDRLVRIGGVNGTPSPNGGQLTAIGALGVDASGAVGFEILASGGGLASLKVGDATRLYTINLTSGAATALGKIGDGTTRIDAITALPREEIVFGTTATNRLISFRAAAPDKLLSNVALTGLSVGEVIAGIDFRPATGQLFGLTSTNRAVIINQSTGQVIQVGAAIDGALFAAGAQAGFDFNPTVDRLRLVNANDDNLRFNPVTSTVVDGDPMIPDTQADTDLAYNAGDPNLLEDPNVNAAAYDRNDNDGTTATTLFGIDTTLNILVRQGAIDGNAGDIAGGGSPNGGLLNTLGTLGVDPTDVVGMDIINNGTLGHGAALAVMQLQGETVSKLFQINLTAGLANQTQGTATLIGTVGGGQLVTAMAIAPPSIQFSTNGYTVNENGTNAVIAVMRTGSVDVTSTVTVDTLDDSATAGADYTALVGAVVTFAPGETRKTVLVPITNDNTVEDEETLFILLSAPTGGTTTLGDVSSAVLTLLDND